ncbi:hypothetical protein MYSTI_01968 [Myxococcus stipitatus DSM 14675]|uniref:Uncharacterized protein n=1 Tax=Myxococcus stipitatus (strain DSM 14675 / JCM 12634 / Mx s8) TaxID=1278073 RepID=L7U6U5_MYXSD|nr:hypothetical protein MYSTI_01968 [Myxococcus stipitatus DSM 14675]
MTDFVRLRFKKDFQRIVAMREREQAEQLRSRRGIQMIGRECAGCGGPLLGARGHADNFDRLCMRCRPTSAQNAERGAVLP